MARTSGKPHAESARELGMTGGALWIWPKQADLDEGKRSDGLTSDEQEEQRQLRRENRILRVEREKAHHAVVTLCRVLDVSPSGYGAWRKRRPSPRAQADPRRIGERGDPVRAQARRVVDASGRVGRLPSLVASFALDYLSPDAYDTRV